MAVAKQTDKKERELPPDVVMEYREAFTLFDKDGDGFITDIEFCTVVRSIGINPSQKELAEMLALAEKPSRIDFNTFLKAMKSCKRKPDVEEDLIRAFQIFDKKNSGRVKSTEIKTALTTLGEVLKDMEIDELIRMAQPNPEGEIDYRDFARKIFKVSSPEIYNNNGKNRFG